jgi:hypothetical protein
MFPVMLATFETENFAHVLEQVKPEPVNRLVYCAHYDGAREHQDRVE